MFTLLGSEVTQHDGGAATAWSGSDLSHSSSFVLFLLNSFYVFLGLLRMHSKHA